MLLPIWWPVAGTAIPAEAGAGIAPRQ